MDKKKYIIIAGCRSAAKYADDVYHKLREDPEVEPSLLRLRLENIDFADSKVRPKIVQVHRATSGKDKDLSDALLNSHLLLFQHMQNPFAKDPDLYAADKIMAFMDQFKIPSNLKEARIAIREQRLEERLNDYLMDLAEMEQHKSGEWRGFIKSYFMQKGQRKLKPVYLAGLVRLFRDKKGIPRSVLRDALRTGIRDVIQPRYASTEIMEFFSTVFNAYRRGCRNITAVWPFSDGRSDRFARGENNETEDLADTARHKGVRDLITIRMHSKDKQEDIWRRYGIGVHNIDSTKYLAEKLVNKYEDLIRQRKLVVASMDLGGRRGVINLTSEMRAIALAGGLIDNEEDIPCTIMDKKRVAAHDVDDISIYEGYGLNDPAKLEGTSILLYDDMVDTAGSYVTFDEKIALQYKVKEVILVTEHPVLSYPAARNLSKAFYRGSLRAYHAFDTIPQPERPFLELFDSAPLVVAKIKEMFFPENGLKLPQNPN